MSVYANGANDFQKFERARDELAARGGGVLYYPAGTYDFSAHPQGQRGRGLMLKKGVVILGQAPARGQGHQVVVDSVTPGLLGLRTVFQFPYHAKPAVTPDTGYVPDVWNQIGLYADGTERVSDQTFTGVAWVRMDGGYVYSGPDFVANPDYGIRRSYLRARKTVNAGDSLPWARRIARNDLPFDGFVTVNLQTQTTLAAPGGFHFIFGCRLENSAVNNEALVFIKDINSLRPDSSGPSDYSTYRNGARISAYGPSVFVSNNALPPATKCFYYRQRIKGYLSSTNAIRYDTLLYDYGNTHGIDVNKIQIPALRGICDYRNGSQFAENVFIADNYIYNHGHCGINATGKYMTIRSNTNQRHFLRASDDIYGLGGPRYTLNSDGFFGTGPNADNYARAMDVGGINAWFHDNYWEGTGSNPANDGEGIFIQNFGGVIVASWAQTYNRMGYSGKDSYVFPYLVPVYGLTQFCNYWKGGIDIDNRQFRVEDAAVVDNYRIDRVTPILPNTTGGSTSLVNIGDLLTTCPTGTPAPPSQVIVSQPPGQFCNRITWVDEADNEIGFRIDRHPANDTTWQLVAYRPRNQTGGVDSNLSLLEAGSLLLGCPNQGLIDLNVQEWNDYLGQPGQSYVYRVVAINCADNNAGGKTALPAPPFPATAIKIRGAAQIQFSLYPHPAKDNVLVRTSGLQGYARLTLTDALGRTHLFISLIGDAKPSLAGLPPGLYHIMLQDGQGFSQAQKLLISR